MVRMIQEQIMSAPLVDVTRREVDLYAGNAFNATLYAIADEKKHIYTVISIPNHPRPFPAGIVVMARVVGNYVIIEEDRTLDKPLVDALMINGGVPREKSLLAYTGEKLPYGAKLRAGRKPAFLCRILD